MANKKWGYSLKEKYRSGFEAKVIKALNDLGITYEYETRKLNYIVPQSKHVYTPDIVLTKHDERIMFIEVKGLFDAEDRKKHLYVRESNKDLDIRLLFQNSNAKIRKGSKTTYADWCNKNDFLYADKVIPQSWLDELKDAK
jgi:predicted nuclease of restriction endonuclease-like RecB superfamily